MLGRWQSAVLRLLPRLLPPGVLGHERTRHQLAQEVVCGPHIWTAGSEGLNLFHPYNNSGILIGTHDGANQFDAYAAHGDICF